MPGKVILGAQWGDEGKGKFIDIFAGKADLVVRSQGGNNAGHTVVAGGEKYKLQLIPSGILYPECVNVIGPGVVVNPKAVLGEIDGLHEKGVSTDKLFIDARCHCRGTLSWMRSARQRRPRKAPQSAPPRRASARPIWTSPSAAASACTIL